MHSSFLIELGHFSEDITLVALVWRDICRYEQEECGHWQSFTDIAPRFDVWCRRTILPDTEKRDDSERGNDEYDTDDSKIAKLIREETGVRKVSTHCFCSVGFEK